MGIPGVKVSGQHGQSRTRVWEELQQRGAGTQETPPPHRPASEPLPLLLQGQPGLPGPPGLPVSITYKGFKGSFVDRGTCKMSHEPKLSFCSRALASLDLL